MMNESRVIGLIKALGENGSGGGGGGVFIVHGETTDMQSATISAPFEEAWAAYETGKFIVCRLKVDFGNGIPQWYDLPCISKTNDDNTPTMHYGSFINGASLSVIDRVFEGARTSEFVFYSLEG
jgi:hypothetical protein